MNRRKFLKGLGVFGLATAMACTLPGCSKDDMNDINPETNIDGEWKCSKVENYSYTKFEDGTIQENTDTFNNDMTISIHDNLIKIRGESEYGEYGNDIVYQSNLITYWSVISGGQIITYHHDGYEIITPEGSSYQYYPDLVFTIIEFKNNSLIFKVSTISNVGNQFVMGKKVIKSESSNTYYCTK